MSASQKPALANITSVLNEKRLFPPPKEFSARARIKSMAQYRKLYGESIRSSYQGQQSTLSKYFHRPQPATQLQLPIR